MIFWFIFLFFWSGGLKPPEPSYFPGVLAPRTPAGEWIGQSSNIDTMLSVAHIARLPNMVVLWPKNQKNRKPTKKSYFFARLMENALKLKTNQV